MRRPHPALCLALLSACAKNTPDLTQRDGGGDAQTPNLAVLWALPAVDGDNPACTKAVGDFTPDDPDDGWPPCVSDNNSYVRIEPTISSIARVAAFEAMLPSLFAQPAPTPGDFTDARLAYAQPEGLQSRVSRREDEHFPRAPTSCRDITDPTVLEANRQRCAGQAQIQPTLDDAFVNGQNGNSPLLQAARIEAALLWFLYLSTHKEAITCTDSKKDCDSSYAYYTGGQDRTGGLGLSRYFSSLSAQAHNRVWDGVLAVRCWRDTDPENTATDLSARDRAIGQLDRALLRGFSLIVKSRTAALQAEDEPSIQEALWASVQILGSVLLREASVRDSTKSTMLQEQLESTTADRADLDMIRSILDEVFPCP